MKKSALGFTLIELIMVMVILGILSSIAIYTMPNATKRARDARRKSDIRQYLNALEVFANKYNGFYPDVTTSCDASSDACVCGYVGMSGGCPDDPNQPVNHYFYQSNGIHNNGGSDATQFVLYATLEVTNDTGDTQYWVSCSNGRNGVTTNQPTDSACPVIPAQ